MFNAVVIAGGGKPEVLTEQEGVSNKAFIKVHGRPLLAYIISALEGAPLARLKNWKPCTRKVTILKWYRKRKPVCLTILRLVWR
jgi:GTP:adenosylcobinamide-phosphate guanylyltransferase